MFEIPVGAVRVTDEERREVAEKLRRMVGYMRERCAWYGKDDDAEACGNAAYRNIADSVIPYSNNGSHYIEVVERVADLIDPQERTCINESASGKYFKCSECGAELMQITPGWVALVSGRVNYCPNCGARVVDEEDNDD